MEADPLELFCNFSEFNLEDYDTSEPIDWNSLGIHEEMFEEVADANKQFQEWAENGIENGKLKISRKNKICIH